jgi:hypothetical protein
MWKPGITHALILSTLVALGCDEDGGDDHVDSDTLAELDCQVGDVPKLTAEGWTCSPGDPGGDDPHDHEVATPSNDGFMAASDKAKLDEIEESANAYDHPTTGTCPQDPAAHSHPIGELDEPTAHGCRWRVVRETSQSTVVECTDVAPDSYAIAGGCYSQAGSTENLVACFPTGPFPEVTRFGNGGPTANYDADERASGWWGRWASAVDHEVAVLCCQF